tara:strand:- start:646 stop:1695 length:1050 start_codon:yes stop_codon:yes gene_type:complete
MKINENSLGNYDNPNFYNDPVKITEKIETESFEALKLMVKIRMVEDIISKNVKDGVVNCPCHLSNGQEAIPVSVSMFLNKTDYIFGNHRSHGHYLACGGSAYKLFAEVLGKATGCARGMGGSMHICSIENGFIGSVPIVAGTIPTAVGAALTSKLNKSGAIAVSYFGDGATEEGTFHEALNLSSKLSLPILFVCENNLFSSHLHISERQPKKSTSRFALANGIDSFVEDGNNIVSLIKTLSAIIPKIRKKQNPFFLEAITYRLKGHVGHDENIDVGLNRSDDLSKWKKRDPIKRTLNGLINFNSIYEKKYNDYKNNLYDQLLASWEKAINDPFPNKEQLLDTVYYNEKK